MVEQARLSATRPNTIESASIADISDKAAQELRLQVALQFALSKALERRLCEEATCAADRRLVHLCLDGNEKQVLAAKKRDLQGTKKCMKLR